MRRYKEEELKDLTPIQLATVWAEAVSATEEAKSTIAYEQMVRKACAAAYFPQITEGTSYVDLAEGWRIKRVLPFDRKVVPEAVAAVSAALLAIKVDPGALFIYKPELSTAAFKKLPEDIQAIVNQAVVTKPGSLALELVPPKVKE